MKYYYQLLIISIALVLISFTDANAQIEKNTQATTPFYIDAIGFKGKTDSLSRVDVFVLVPYQTLKFVKSNDTYSSQYELVIRAVDSSKKKVAEKRIQRKLQESDYYTANGGTGKFDYSQTIFQLPKGVYDIDVLMIDNLSNQSTEKSRSMTLINFADYKFSISGILLVSTIEEQNGKFIITPHVSDNVGDLIEGYFAFFEVYDNAKLDSVDFIYELSDSKGEVIDTGKRMRKYLKDSTIQNYFKIPYSSKMQQGTYILRIIALKPSDSKTYTKLDYLAVAERSIRFYHYISGFAIKDIDKAVHQLKYVANQKDLDYIEAAPNQGEKQTRFEEFWKKLDPTPNTDRNEAFEEYYSRIDFADKEFKSYTEGWLTDMGMVFVVYGRPMNIQKSGMRSDGKKYEVWTYANNRQYTFVDRTGTGDFHFANYAVVGDKYEYKP